MNVKQTRLDFFKSGMAWTGLQAGIVSTGEYMKWIRYNIFLEFEKEKNITRAIALASDKARCSEATMRRAVNHFR